MSEQSTFDRLKAEWQAASKEFDSARAVLEGGARALTRARETKSTKLTPL